MILIFGGTTEGRTAVNVIEAAGKPYFYSTQGTDQRIDCRQGEHVTGAMDAAAMTDFCRQKAIRLIVDAAHPFATGLHQNISEAAERLHIPVIRLERQYPPRHPEIIWCKDFPDAVRQLKNRSVKRLLALTGVNSLTKLRDYWQEHDCWFRILRRKASEKIRNEVGFPPERIIFYENDGMIDSWLIDLAPDAILVKESGESGGFSEKINAAFRHGIQVFAIERPPMPDSFHVVTGRYTLRRKIEQLLPDFFELRSGVTTGTCATAAAKTALASLLNHQEYEEIQVTLPDGERLSLPVEFVNFEADRVTVGVRKEAGDDPDVTNGVIITATVAFNPQHANIRFIGGEGIGTVTLPGLGIEVGGPAINPVPRQMMEQELRRLYAGGLDVTLSVPGGEELAQRTFNHRVGVIGGLSIIGTSGIIQPFSHEAFIEAIRREFEVAAASGISHIVLNSGARSERIVKAQYPMLPPQAFIHYGNAIGESLKIAQEMNFPTITMGLMLGKAVKLAEGNLDTHSHKVLINTSFLQTLAAEGGCSPEALATIGRIQMARELWGKLAPSDAERFFPLLLKKCREHCTALLSENCRFELFLITDEGEIACQSV